MRYILALLAVLALVAGPAAADARCRCCEGAAAMSAMPVGGPSMGGPCARLAHPGRRPAPGSGRCGAACAMVGGVALATLAAKSDARLAPSQETTPAPSRAPSVETLNPGRLDRPPRQTA